MVRLGMRDGSRGRKFLMNWVCVRTKSLYHAQCSDTLWSAARQAPLSMGFSRQEHWSGCHALLQGIFPTQGLNLCLLCFLHWQVGYLPVPPPWKPELAIGHGKNKCQGCCQSCGWASGRFHCHLSEMGTAAGDPSVGVRGSVWGMFSLRQPDDNVVGNHTWAWRSGKRSRVKRWV